MKSTDKFSPWRKVSANSIENRYQVARRQEADLARSVGQLENKTLTDQGKGAKYNALKRNADSDRQLYEALLQRSNSLTTSSAVIPESFLDRRPRRSPNDCDFT